MLSRKIALPLSLALTALLGFVITSFATNAGWLSEAAQQAEVAVVQEPTATATMEARATALPASPIPPADTVATAEPEVVEVVDYVYQDVPVYRVVPAATATEAPAAISTGQSGSFSIGTSSNGASTASEPENMESAPATASSPVSTAPTSADSNQPRTSAHTSAAASAPTAASSSVSNDNATQVSGADNGTSASPSATGEPVHEDPRATPEVQHEHETPESEHEDDH